MQQQPRRLGREHSVSRLEIPVTDNSSSCVAMPGTAVEQQQKSPRPMLIVICAQLFSPDDGSEKREKNAIPMSPSCSDCSRLSMIEKQCEFLRVIKQAIPGKPGVSSRTDDRRQIIAFRGEKFYPGLSGNTGTVTGEACFVPDGSMPMPYFTSFARATCCRCVLRRLGLNIPDLQGEQL